MSLMHSTSKVYVVSKCGGEYEDRWERIVGVCSSSELADLLKHKIEEKEIDDCDSDEEYEEDLCEVIIEEFNLFNNLFDVELEWRLN